MYAVVYSQGGRGYAHGTYASRDEAVYVAAQLRVAYPWADDLQVDEFDPGEVAYLYYPLGATINLGGRSVGAG